MATLREMLRRINGVKSTSKITQAMKMVSVAKLRRAQDAIINARPYVSKMEELLANLVSAVGDDYFHPLAESHKEIKSIAIIVISSDRSLCGSFNSNLFRSALTYIRQTLPSEYPNAKVSLLTVGKRACSSLPKEKYPIISQHPGIFHNLQFQTAKDIIQIVKSGYESGEYDMVMIYYNKFVNLIKQIPSYQIILPVKPKASDSPSSFKTDYIFEPDIKTLMDELLPKLLDIQMWRTLLESNAAEQAARMMAMDNATTNAKELIRSLGIIYNKERQAAITKEMLEIVGGAEALQKG